MTSLEVPMLDKSNYDNWFIKMKAPHGTHDVWEIIEISYSELQNEEPLSQPQRDSLKDARNRDKKAFILIYQALDNDGFENISSATTAKETW